MVCIFFTLCNDVHNSIALHNDKSEDFNIRNAILTFSNHTYFLKTILESYGKQNLTFLLMYHWMY